MKQPLWCGVLGASLVFASALTAKENLPLEKKIFTSADGKTLPYRLLKPEPYDPQVKYPLVLFLHGAGERGSDNAAQLRHGVPEFDKPENRKKYPCFLIAPQCPTGQKWADWRLAKPADQPSEPLRLALEALDQVRKEYSVDPNRLYVTGLSMGGFGTWDLLRHEPKKFAAAVIICGGGNEADAPKLAKVPVWVFHGAKDQAVPVERSRTMVEALKKAGGHPKYTEYPTVEHNSWVPAYRDAAMFEWLFAQRRR